MRDFIDFLREAKDVYLTVFKEDDFYDLKDALSKANIKNTDGDIDRGDYYEIGLVNAKDAAKAESIAKKLKISYDIEK